MTDRERLIELLFQANDIVHRNGFKFNANVMADHLLAHGVIVPPCKVGDTVYEIEYGVDYDEFWEKQPLETKVKAVCILTENDYYPIDRVGKDVFLTREEAEKECEGE